MTPSTLPDPQEEPREESATESPLPSAAPAPAPVPPEPVTTTAPQRKWWRRLRRTSQLTPADPERELAAMAIPAGPTSLLYRSPFQIGFLIFLPFLVIDLVVANILLALGMMMLSPTTISLPFKLLLFVLIDGWAKLVHGLVLTYGA